MGQDGEGGVDRQSSMETYTPPFVKQTVSANLLFDLGSSNRDSVITWGGREAQGRGDMYTYD